METIPANLLVPLGAIFAALIAGFFSFLSLVISKEQKVSEFRQAWIDKLREDVSKYVSSISYLSSANDVWIDEGRPNPLEHYKAMLASFDTASQAYTSIVLHINPSDSDETIREENDEFLSQLGSVRDAVRNDEYTVAKNYADGLSEKVQPILKHEWERLRKGERVYRLSLYGTGVILVVGLLSGLVFTFRAYYNPPVVPANQTIKPYQDQMPRHR